MTFLRPWRYLRSVTDIDIQELIKLNIKLILFDFDNTLTSHRSEVIDKKILDHLRSIESFGIKLYILSNAKKYRISSVLEKLKLNGRGMSYKPLTFVINKVIKSFCVSKKEVVLIGDQIFTDVIAGNFAGIKTVLVDRISDDEALSIRLRRKLEANILKGNRYDD